MDSTLIIVIVAASILLSFLLPRFLLPILTGAKKRSALVRTGQQARAVITSLDQTGTYINEQPKCRIGLRVEPASGAPFETSAVQVVLLTQIPQFQPGQVVTVRFDPADHAQVAIEALGHVTVTEADARRLIEDAERLRERLSQMGTPASAVVTAFTPTGINVNGDNPLARVSLKVLPAGGQPFDSTLVGVFGQEGLHKYQPGKTIQVRFDPADPGQVTVDRPAGA